jgi:hypothetical protein
MTDDLRPYIDQLDPDHRIAALAEAIDHAATEIDAGGIYTATGAWVTSPAFAAAILAALPPGWCGHIGLAEGELLNDLSDKAEYIVNQQAEIARLRRIEEAARRVVLEWDEWEVQHGKREYVAREVDALRAALEEKP